MRGYKVVTSTTVWEGGPQLQAAAPDPWLEMHPDDAATRGLVEGSLVCVSSARGSVTVPVRLDGAVPGQVFIPFHYGQQAENELTPDRWDPVSKQPEFKGGTANVQVAPVADTGGQPVHKGV